MKDCRDYVIEMLADDEAATSDALVDAICERDAYRQAYLVTVAQVHAEHQQVVARDRTIIALRDELRRYTAGQVTTEQRAA